MNKKLTSKSLGLDITIPTSKSDEKIYYNKIVDNITISGYAYKWGFWKVGQILLKAKENLKGVAYQHLSKRLNDEGVVLIRTQQRLIEIASNERIQKNIGKLPPKWSVIQYVSKLDDKDFHKIEHLLNPTRDIEMNDLVSAINPKQITTKSSSKKIISQVVDDEVFATFKLKKQMPKLEKKKIIKELKKLQEKYSSFINLDVEELDDILELESETLKEQYSSKRKLKLKKNKD